LMFRPNGAVVPWCRGAVVPCCRGHVVRGQIPPDRGSGAFRRICAPRCTFSAAWTRFWSRVCVWGTHMPRRRSGGTCPCTRPTGGAAEWRCRGGAAEWRVARPSGGGAAEWRVARVPRPRGRVATARGAAPPLPCESAQRHAGPILDGPCQTIAAPGS
jgi:hypothetical protein